ncbi:pleckstrin homology domain-containing family G member 4B-like isoform X2 [Pseudophryne corroboree]|uniref:pleckstrin homology domain-containing family G member 4B-like isoform X2 n=1 Tax=Pseudophryne corroboree TaxID=495146 RepID=UPI003081DEB9
MLKDSQSLDNCIQKTLSSLYHPFESTAATVLCQVLDVVEKTYRGDGLSYLIDFLIPAKRVLQGLQQEACLQYCGLLFRHAGWPLCIHDKIVLQLASIDWRLLQPGDFYLQVVPYLKKTPRIVLKCLAEDLHNVKEVVLPDASYTSIFTSEWLEFINSEQIGPSLENCLLTSDEQLFRVPWDMIVHPEFVEKTQSTESPAKVCETSELVAHKGNDESAEPHMGDLMVQQEEEDIHEYPAVLPGQDAVVNDLDVHTEISSEMEGEYVELRDIKVPRFGPQLGSLTQSIALNYKSQQKSTQRAQSNQNLSILSSRNCTEIPVCLPLQPPDKVTIMGASVTHYDTNYAQKPESINLVDVEFGGRESLLLSDTSLSVDKGAKDFHQTFSLENEALLEVSVEAGDADTKEEADNSTQSCLQPSSEPDNYSTSLTFQEENRSHFRECTGDAWGMTDATQEPVVEHSRTPDSEVIEALEASKSGLSEASKPQADTEESDQSVPLLLNSLESDSAPLENAEDVITDDISGLDLQDLKHSDLPAAEESPQIVDICGQSVQDAPEEGQGLHLAACGEQLGEADPQTVTGEATDLTVETGERTEPDSPYYWGEGERSPTCLQHTSSLLSAQLPLETLHEDTEEEQAANADSLSDSTDAAGGEEPAPSTAQSSDQERTQEKRPQRDQSLSWRQGPGSPGVLRRREGQTLPTRVRDVNLEVLVSGMVYVPGTRDRSGRSLVIINTRNTCWLNPYCNASELGRLLLYFYSTVRRDCRMLGLTLLVDARRCSPVPALFKALHMVQAAVPGCIHGVLLLAEKDLVLSLERPQGVQFDILTSTKSLHKHIEASQLPPTFYGPFPYSHQDWLAFRTKLENLQDSCCDACVFLQNAIHNMHSSFVPEKAEEARLQLTRFGELMRTVLEDTRLVKLQTEGGAVLARLRKEESCVMLTEDYREAVDMAAELYNRVDEGVHSLVRLSNKRIHDLELVKEVEAFEERFQEVGGWIENVGERLLGECSVLEDSLEVLLQTQRHFQEFDGVACEYCRRGQEMLQSMDKWQDLSSPEVQKCTEKIQRCKEKVGDFSRRLEECRNRLEKTVRLYQFFDKAYEWALEGMRHLAAISFDDCNSPELCAGAVESLEKYQVQHPEIGEKKFEEMRELAYELKSEKGAKQWKFAWSKCQEARQVFEKKLEAALRAKGSLSGDQSSPRLLSHRRNSDAVDRKVPYFLNEPKSPQCSRVRRLGRVLCNRPEVGNTTDQIPYAASPFGSTTSSIASSAFRVRKLSLQSVPGEDLHLHLLQQVPSGSSTPTPCRPMGRRLLRKAQSFDLPGSDVGSHGCQRRLSEPGRRGNTGVFIKGLEVSSTELADRPCSPRQPPPLDWSAERLLRDRRSSVSSADGRSRSSKLRHIIDEMVTTEREYVRSLWYITENYFPEMDRMDLPQDLRGKRGIIFGNLEKLRDFHSQYFLKELESCCNHPLRVSHCFLRHKDQFGMYALYSKNKPRSNLLLASHGNIFFKNKQRQLGDKMDLASYLLKPIQRMSKYALLLKDLIKECSEAQEQELVYLRAAEEMVKFQLRHGNDLLAMDAIRDCDVNLKEQGQLVRQDEFTVWLGRRKCQRHVFLFEDLILFSKPKRIEGGLDVYIYKRSFKTADIGLTENSGDSGLRFEIWFRRRKSNDTHILQASNADIKQAWTVDIAKILWQQATRNKEVRMQEMVSMGVGNKPFLDIKPSDAAINNRAIDYIMKGRGVRTRVSIAVSLFDHSDPYKRTQDPITCSSVPSACGPSSASLLGPLNLHMYVNQTLLPGVLSANRPFETSSCLEEDELENETSCSQPSMTTESSESSQCMSGAGSSGSDSGCISSIPQDNLSEDAGSPCYASAQYTFPERRNSSSIISPVVEKSRFINRQYISANPRHISLSPSTIV